MAEPLIKPMAAISDPPAYEDDGDGCQESPQNGQNEICDQTQDHETDPEDFPSHLGILIWVSNFPFSRETYKYKKVR
jgi:hypothetical protein